MEVSKLFIKESSEDDSCPMRRRQDRENCSVKGNIRIYRQMHSVPHLGKAAYLFITIKQRLTHCQLGILKEHKNFDLEILSK